MKVLHLTLKKKWFDMILSGEKIEEYREFKEYWVNRLTEDKSYCGMGNEGYVINAKTFDAIKFTNGYAKEAPTFTIECKGIEIGKPNTKWCDIYTLDYDKDNGSYEDVFVIKLGEIISLSR